MGQGEVVADPGVPKVEVRGIFAQPCMPRDAVGQAQLEDPA